MTSTLARCGHTAINQTPIQIRNPAGRIVGEVYPGPCVWEWRSFGYRADGSWEQLGLFESRAEAEAAIRSWSATEGRTAA